jgi:hypothetical protein
MTFANKNSKVHFDVALLLMAAVCGVQRDWPALNELPYLMLRDSPCGDTSNAATVDVRTRVHSIATNGNKKEYFFKISSETPRVIRVTVGTFDVSPLGLSCNITTRFWVFVAHVI